MVEPQQDRWLLLIHQIPPKPSYFRVKVWRRLQRFGAVAIKNSVYVLPKNEQSLEDFHWVSREILEGGGEATVLEARFVEGITDNQVVSLFHAARDADYAQLADDARTLLGDLLDDKGAEERHPSLSTELARLKKRFAELAEIDFFEAPGKEAAEVAISELLSRVQATQRGAALATALDPTRFRGCVWVTRKGIKSDRMASAWLIRRFIDPEARFKYVPAKGYKPEPGEWRFDMFEAEFTHEGDRCTLEVLIERFRLGDPALTALAEIIHDIDLKDEKFKRPEAPGVSLVISGIAQAHPEDGARLERGSAVFDDLYELFRRTPV